MLGFSYIFEISKIEKFLLFIFLIIFILTFVRIVYVNLFSKKFYLFYILIGILIIFNIFICFSSNLVFSIIVLIILSFLSLFAIFIGYGISFEICFIIPFKLLADIFLMLYLGSHLFLINEWEVIILANFYNFSFTGNYFLFLAFLIYSLCGILGFWIYWAMEGSYFISSYLHSVGFILISTVIFIKAFYLGLFEEFSHLLFKLEIFFFFSFVFFLICFLVVKKIKKGFGYFSCSGVSFVFFLLVISPSIGISYFFLSSIIKVVFFELMGVLFGKSTFPNEEDIRVHIEKVKHTYLFLFLSVLVIIFLISGEFFYFYINSDGLLDFYFINDFIAKIFYFVIFLKIVGLICLIIRTNLIYLKMYLTFYFNKAYKVEGSRFWLWYLKLNEIETEEKIFHYIYLSIYSMLKHIFEFESHFINFIIMLVAFPLFCFIRDFYKSLKINPLEYSIKYIFWKTFWYLLDKENLKFNLEFKRISRFFSFLKSNNIIIINFFFVLLILLLLFLF